MKILKCHSVISDQDNDLRKEMMKSMAKLDTNRLFIFHEGRKRRILVGELSYIKDQNVYELTYDEKYACLKRAIPLGPDLDLLNLRHQSEKGVLFSSFSDRIPDRDNPAYEDYCKAQSISSDEKNQIILLTTIARRGPSSFTYEKAYINQLSVSDITDLREKLNITQHDLAAAFDISQQTLQRIESGASHDHNTLKSLQFFVEFFEVALWQLKQTDRWVHTNVLDTLIKHLESQKGPAKLSD